MSYLDNMVLRRGVNRDMRIEKRFLLVGLTILTTTMVIATQYAVTRIGYEYIIVHPSDSSIRYIGSDNSSDGIRTLRVEGDNVTNIRVKLFLGRNFSANQTKYYSAAFGIVNEERFPINITHIDVSSSQSTYLRIWLHGDRDANANNTLNDPSSVLMYDNGTIINDSNTIAWTLAPGDENPNTMCSNVSDRSNYSINTTWDDVAHVRYSLNDTNAVSGVADFVWVQVALVIPDVVDSAGLHTGNIIIYYTADTL